MTLYEMNAALASCVDVETGEIIDESKLEALAMARDEKIENIAIWIKNLKAMAEAIKAEKMALQKRQAVAENKIKALTNFLGFALNGESFETAKVKLSFRRSATVDIFDESRVPAEYMIQQDPVPDKRAIQAQLKAGQMVPGCRMKENYNLQIK